MSEDTTEGLRERIEAALRSTWGGAPTVMEDAIHEEAAAVMAVVAPMMERQRTALAATRSDVDAMQREVHRHVLANAEQQGEVERLRAELAEAKSERDEEKRRADWLRGHAEWLSKERDSLRVQRDTWEDAADGWEERAERVTAERDHLRETLAETDLGARILALEETVAAADADRDRLEAELAEAREKHQANIASLQRLADRLREADDRRYAAALAERDALKAAVEGKAIVEKEHLAEILVYVFGDDDFAVVSAAARDGLLASMKAALDAPETTKEPAAKPEHIGNGANAEDCPACSGTNPPYPFICPGEPETPGDARTEDAS